MYVRAGTTTQATLLWGKEVGGGGCGPHFPAFSAFFSTFSGQVP